MDKTLRAGETVGMGGSTLGRPHRLISASAFIGVEIRNVGDGLHVVPNV